MEKKIFKCINAEGVYNITEGNLYECKGIQFNGSIKQLIILNDSSETSYYNESRFVEICDIIDKPILSMDNINGNFMNDIPIIASNLVGTIKNALDMGMKFNKSEYEIYKNIKSKEYILTLVKYSYDGSITDIIKETDYAIFIKKMNIISHGLSLDSPILPDYWKNTYGNYINDNIDNKLAYNVRYGKNASDTEYKKKEYNVAYK